MSENVPIDLLMTWNKWGQFISYALFAVGVLVVVFHLFRLVTITDNKNKYDYINAPITRNRVAYQSKLISAALI